MRPAESSRYAKGRAQRTREMGWHPALVGAVVAEQ
jgi:hypothetical protein